MTQNPTANAAQIVRKNAPGIYKSGTVVCPIWGEVGLEGVFHLLIHYIRNGGEITLTAAYSRYNGQLTDITDKIRTLKLNPDWKDRVPSQ